jgi:hypothetical protein
MRAFFEGASAMQGFRKLALFVGAASLAGGGVFVVACGTDNGSSTVATPQVEAGKTDTGTPPVDGGGGTDSATTDSGVDCSNNPILRDNTSSFRCAFLSTGSADGGVTCENTQTCCNGDKVGGVNQKGFCASAKGGDTVCAAQAVDAGTQYVTGAAWECADKSACPGSQVCCMIQDPVRLAADPVKNKLNIGNTPPTNTKHPAACKAQYAYNAGGSRCKAACEPAKNDLLLCSLTDNSCGAGTTCTPFVDFTNFIDRAYCK